MIGAFLGHIDTDKTLALAGLFQAGRCVVDLAQKSSHDEASLRCIADSVLKLEDASTEAVFGGRDQLRLGLETVRDLLRATPKPIHKELIRYVVSMAQLSERLSRTPEMATKIADGVNTLADEGFEAGSDSWFLELSELYQSTLSQLEPKIMVRGARGRLESISTVSRVRAALFGGVRSAYLWRQLGGRRWHLMFQRRQYIERAQYLMTGEV